MGIRRCRDATYKRYKMMIRGAFGFYFLVALVSAWGRRNSTILMIDRVGIPADYRPKEFIEPSQWMRKLFKIRKRVILKFCWVELHIVVFYALICPINMLITIISHDRWAAIHVLTTLQTVFFTVDTICFLAVALFYRKRYP